MPTPRLRGRRYKARTSALEVRACHALLPMNVDEFEGKASMPLENETLSYLL